MNINIRGITLKQPINRSVKQEPSPNAIIKTVKKDGIIGANCDFTDIKSALDSINDNSATKPYIVKILEGTYDVSNDGNLYLGLKNYVDIIGESKENVKIIKNENTYSSDKSTFDPAYYRQEINYASIRNLTITSFNTKAPIHIDGGELNGKIEIINCNLINNNTSDMQNFENCLACGLRKNQSVIVRDVTANGMLWAHNWNTHYDKGGCNFELYNCTAKYIRVGDLLSYGEDKCIIENCKIDSFKLSYYKNFGGQLTYVQPSFDIRLNNNTIKYVSTDLSDSSNNNDYIAFDELYDGKWSITDSSIHKKVKNASYTKIKRGDLLTQTKSGVKKWSKNDKLYGVALDNISLFSKGIIQYNGTVTLKATASIPIQINDELELNANGLVTKRTTGSLIGYAKQELLKGTSSIKVDLSLNN